MAIFCGYPEQTQPLTGHDWIVAHGYSDEAIVLQAVSLIHKGPDPHTNQPDPTLNVIGTLITVEPTFWAAYLPGLTTAHYELKLEFLYSGLPKTVLFPTTISIQTAVQVEVLFPRDEAHLDPKYFVTFGDRTGGPLPSVTLAQQLAHGHSFNLDVFAIGATTRWHASKKLVPVHDGANYRLIATVRGGNTVIRNLTFTKVARQKPIPN
ncbi:MAG: hypothetical protein SNJ82_03615 [Gemmataceae bacterium]